MPSSALSNCTKHDKGGSIPFGAWLGLSCQATNISPFGALNCAVLFTIVNPHRFTIGIRKLEFVSKTQFFS